MQEVECKPKQAGWFFHLIRVEWEFSLVWIFTVQWHLHVQGSGFSKTTETLCGKVIPGWDASNRLYTFPLYTWFMFMFWSCVALKWRRCMSCWFNIETTEFFSCFNKVKWFISFSLCAVFHISEVFQSFQYPPVQRFNHSGFTWFVFGNHCF